MVAATVASSTFVCGTLESGSILSWTTGYPPTKEDSSSSTPLMPTSSGALSWRRHTQSMSHPHPHTLTSSLLTLSPTHCHLTLCTLTPSHSHPHTVWGCGKVWLVSLHSYATEPFPLLSDFMEAMSPWRVVRHRRPWWISQVVWLSRMSSKMLTMTSSRRFCATPSVPLWWVVPSSEEGRKGGGKGRGQRDSSLSWAAQSKEGGMHSGALRIKLLHNHTSYMGVYSPSSPHPLPLPLFSLPLLLALSLCLFPSLSQGNHTWGHGSKAILGAYQGPRLLCYWCSHSASAWEGCSYSEDSQPVGTARVDWRLEWRVSTLLTRMKSHGIVLTLPSLPLLFLSLHSSSPSSFFSPPFCPSSFSLFFPSPPSPPFPLPVLPCGSSYQQPNAGSSWKEETRERRMESSGWATMTSGSTTPTLRYATSAWSSCTRMKQVRGQRSEVIVLVLIFYVPCFMLCVT